MKENEITRRRFFSALVGAAGLAAFGCERRPAQQAKKSPPPAPPKPAPKTPPAAASTPAAKPTALPFVLKLERTLDPGVPELHGVAIDENDRLFLAGGKGLKVIDAEGKTLKEWPAAQPLWAAAAAPGGEVFAAERTRIHRFRVGDPRESSWSDARLRAVSGLAVSPPYLFVADSGARRVYRFDFDGGFLSEYGARDDQAGYPGLMCPSPFLDCAADAHGRLFITNPGLHRVEVFSVEGEMIRCWGQPTLDPKRVDAFYGCCNPSNLALLSDGRVVTGEKIVGRVKVFSPRGELLAAVGPEPFSPKPHGLDAAVDSKDRIWVADPGDGRLKVFVVEKRKA